MKKIVVIHQPDFLSYIGFFHRLLYADLYIILDDVQFVKSNNSWTHRDKIKTKNTEQWLTLSVQKAQRNTHINKILLSNDIHWKVKNLNLIKENYKKSEFFEEIFPYIEKLYSNTDNKLCSFNIKSILLLLELFDIKIKMEYSSSLKTFNAKSEKIVEILTKVNATHYLSGIGAKNYHNNQPFDDANIEVLWQNFEHPIYNQINGEFIPYLSSIDLFFNCGIKKSREILRSI